MSWYHMPDDVAQAARSLAGNWKHAECFVWGGKPENRPEDCALVYLSNRDSDCLDQSNEAAILAELAPWTGSIDDGDHVETQSHNHWAVGHVDGIVIRCLDEKGEPTSAFRKLHELAGRLDGYPVLDEDDFSERETAAADEAWDNFGADDFISCLVRLMPHHDTIFGTVEKGHLWRVWNALVSSGETVIHESGGCFFPFDHHFGKRAGACKLDASDVRAAFLAVAAEDRKYGARKNAAE